MAKISFLLKKKFFIFTLSLLIIINFSSLSFATESTNLKKKFSSTILIYHRFGEDKYPSTNVRIEQFNQHIEKLKSENFNIISLGKVIEAYEKNLTLPEKSITITIDDAFESVYTHAWPILKKEKIPFTLFISTDTIGHKNYMSWEQIKELANKGVEIGNHSSSHFHFNELSYEEIEKDIQVAKRKISQELGLKKQIFSYPYGEYDLEFVNIIKKMGFVAALGQQSSVFNETENLFQMPRFPINEEYGKIDRFDFIINLSSLRVTNVIPQDPNLKYINPPAFGFNVLGESTNLNCFSNTGNEWKKEKLEILEGNRIEVMLTRPFSKGRGRINCTRKNSKGEWEWMGKQFYIP